MRLVVDRRRTAREDGAVVVEFAIVFVLFITLLWGIFTYGIIFAVQQTVTHAAAEAARATVGYSAQDEARDVAHAVAQGQLDWLGTPGAPAPEDVTFGACEAPAADQDCVTVVYEYPWADEPIITPLFQIGTPDVIRGEAVVTWEGD